VKGDTKNQKTVNSRGEECMCVMQKDKGRVGFIIVRSKLGTSINIIGVWGGGEGELLGGEGGPVI